MIITYLKDQNLIKIEAPEILSFEGNIGDYSTVALTGNKCNVTPTTISYNTTEVLNVGNKFFITDGIMYVRPTFFGMSAYTDNVYKFSIKFTLTAGGYTVIENCAFIDITFKCKVAGYLENILKESCDVTDTEKVGTIIHILHYSLINGSNCGCNCSELCQVFTELEKLLDTTNPENTDCGC